VITLASRLFQRRHAAWWTFVAGLMVTAALTGVLLYEARQLDEQRMLRRASEIQNQLDAQLEKSEMLLNNLRDYLSLSGGNRGVLFNRWCHDNGLAFNSRWLHGVLVATNRHKISWRSSFPEPPSQWTKKFMRNFWEFAEKQAVDCEIALSSRITNGTRFFIDYHLRGFGHGVDQFSRAVMNSRLQMSERREIMIDAKTNSMIGTLFYVPVYRPEVLELIEEIQALRPTSYSERAHLYWLHLESMIVAPLSFDVLAEAVREGSPLDLEFEIFSSTNQTAKTWLHNSVGTPRAIDPTFKPYLSLRMPWRMYGDWFSIFFYTTPLFEAQSPRLLAKTAGLSGVVITVLASLLVGVSVRARNRQDRMTGQIREARDALAVAQRERERISRDLHDGTIQSLYAIQLGLGHTAQRLRSEPAHAGSELSAVRRELNGVIAEIRQFITAETAGEAQKEADLCAVLQVLAKRAGGATTAPIELQCDPGASKRVSADQAVQLANIAREALSNALRHGHPQRVNLGLRLDGDFVVLEIADDGVGFEPKTRGGSGLGLVSMKARAAESGGTLAIDSSPGHGTRVVVRLPIAPAETAEPETSEDQDEEP
jgi:signal transduction histidine kinase